MLTSLKNTFFIPGLESSKTVSLFFRISGKNPSLNLDLHCSMKSFNIIKTSAAEILSPSIYGESLWNNDAWLWIKT